MAESYFKVLAQNRQARHEYFIEETYEAGIELTGTEVKSIRLGRLNLKESYIFIKDGECFIQGMHISPYEKGSFNNVDPLRVRRLLLHKSEIVKLKKAAEADGYTLVPTRVYLKQALIKIEIALARGKKLYDKRADLKSKDAQRDIDRARRNLR